MDEIMSKKRVDAGTLKVNRYILLEGEPYKTKALDHSKAGKYGHAYYDRSLLSDE